MRGEGLFLEFSGEGGAVEVFGGGHCGGRDLRCVSVMDWAMVRAGLEESGDVVMLWLEKMKACIIGCDVCDGSCGFARHVM
jgi:hypothetical protein